MKSNQLQRGILFNNYSQLVFFSTNLFKSDADLLLQTFRFIKGDECQSITSDQQIYRDTRSGKAEPTTLLKMLNDTNPEFETLIQQLESYDIEPNEVGAWYILMSQLIGYKASIEKHFTDPHHSVLKYIDFLLAHCELERSFISNFSESEQDNKTEANRIINEWLLTDKLDIFSENKSHAYEYIVSVTLYWTALFEVYMHQEFGKARTTNTFIKSIPQLNTQGSLVRSNEIFLNNVKKYFALKFKSKKFKWTDLSIKIAAARVKNNLHISSNIDEVYSDNEPNQMILQKLKRWRKGYTKGNEKHLSYITMDHYKQYIAIIENKYDKSEKDISLFSIVLLQLWELLQFEGEKLTIPNEVIIDTFAKYPKYVALVEKRFSTFEITGQLSP
ncbi:hypothetical protein N9W11_01285 [Psychrosphaera haliotis]|nr:hypothetical protein [Psychrosphaera haliotis]